ncbi:GNAT family N-acetyltransferase [Leptobacterium flavescens]|uniref:GNAT family N-acetyltransferase n=1 Tax=Leptobacterium flavescens TaxID=472055 RepID=A0A6P0UVQ2_9FLAO|nr:GNAT family N-acetyltransferase [Leptobacterium flavescens]NER14496.1 GNAT family N-acetyltransferase [Leptobacterium flavescens]
MIIRAATNKDREQIVELVLKGLSEFDFDYAKNSSEADLEDIEASYTNAGGLFLIFENGSSVMATGALKNEGEGLFKIRKMYVSNSYRGQGYGRQMLEELIREAGRRNARKIILETSYKMEAAIGLYHSYGFKTVKGPIESPRCDIRMELEYSV